MVERFAPIFFSIILTAFESIIIVGGVLVLSVTITSVIMSLYFIVREILREFSSFELADDGIPLIRRKFRSASGNPVQV